MCSGTGQLTATQNVTSGDKDIALSPQMTAAN